MGTGYVDDMQIVVGSSPIPLTSYFLTIVSDGNGTNSVTGDASLFSQVSVAQGTSTTVVYTANQWFVLSSLTSNGTSVVSDPTGKTFAYPSYSQTFTNIQSSISNNVTFVRPSWTISQTLNGNGTANPSGPVTVLNGLSTTIVYNAAQWYQIKTNLVNGVDQGWLGQTNQSYTFTQVTNDQAIRVSFYRPLWAINQNLDGNGSADGGNPVSIRNGDYATNSYYANLYYQVATITGDGSVQSGGIGYTNATIVAGPVTNTINENLTFVRPTRNVTISIPSGNGGFTGPITIPNGGYVTNVFTGSAWYWVQNISGAGYSIYSGGVDSPAVTLTAGPVTSDISETVNFYKPQWTITQSIGTDGVDNAAAPFQVNNGDPLSLTYTPDPWYQIDLFKSNGVAQAFNPSGVTLSIANVTGNQSVQVDYTRPLWNVTQYILSSSGTCTPAGTVSVLNGTSTQIVYTATSNWFEIATLSSNGIVIGAASNLVAYTQTLFQVQGPVSNAVSFYQPSWTISQTLVGNGTADNPSALITVLNGDTTQIVYNAAQWFEIDTNLVNGVDQSWHGLTNATATFTQVTSNQTISVSFFQPTWTITQIIGANGTADNMASPITVLNGSSTTIIYSASDWYNISALSQYATPVPAATGLQTYPLNFNTITNNQTASVTFSILAEGTNTVTGQSGYNVPTTWLTQWTATQIAGVVGGAPAVEKAYLLNIDPTVDTYTFKVSKLDVNASTVNVTVKLLVDSNTHTNADGTFNINGTLNLYSAGSIGGSWSLVGGAILTNYPGTGEATYTFGSAGAKAFYQAVVE